MTKKSKNAAAAAAEPPAKKSKNAAAAAGGGGDAHRGAFQVGEKVGVAKFAGRPGLLWWPATIVAIREKKWPVVYDIKWGTNTKPRLRRPHLERRGPTSSARFFFVVFFALYTRDALAPPIHGADRSAQVTPLPPTTTEVHQLHSPARPTARRHTMVR